MLSNRKQQAYADAAAALSALRRHNVELYGNFTIRHLQLITSRCYEAIPYANATGDWVGARLYVDGWTWDMVKGRPSIIEAAECHSPLVVDAPFVSCS